VSKWYSLDVRTRASDDAYRESGIRIVADDDVVDLQASGPMGEDPT
jgi:hypothetical protein